MASEEVNVIALVENLELAVPRRLPARFPITVVRTPTQTMQMQTARVIEIGNRDSKLALKRQLNISGDVAEKTVAKSNGASESEERESLEILRRLPPGTFLIKQVETTNSSGNEREDKIANEDVRDDKPRKLSQRIRNKKPLEVLRRNPLRSVSRKDIGKENRPTSSRQRLLTTKRRSTTNITNNDNTNDDNITNNNENSSSSSEQVTTGVKRSRTLSHINTRSVTRKLGNVGAMYKAPTWRDQAEWKEWPVHGMHERPVYHPQFGLAAEYNGRLFASFDGTGYREITAEAQHIEVVRVDPRTDSFDRSLHNLTNTTAAADFLRQQNLVAVRQKLTAATVAATPTKIERPRIPCLSGSSGRWSAFEQMQTNLNLAHHHHHQPHHLDQLRSLERLHQLEVLQRRLGPPRMHHFQATLDPTRYATASRLLSEEMFRSLQQQNPNKCLIVPRGATTTTTTMTSGSLPMPLVHGLKMPKRKLFVISSEVPTKQLTATVTKLDVPSTSREITMQPKSSWFPPARLAETTGMYRPSLRKQFACAEDHRLRSYREFAGYAESVEENQVLDLSKKETKAEVKMEVEMSVPSGMEEKNVPPQTQATDLVRYFQNFSADETSDLFEDPKNLT